MGAVSAAGERRDAVLDAEAHLIATLYVLQRLAADGDATDAEIAAMERVNERSASLL